MGLNDLQMAVPEYYEWLKELEGSSSAAAENIRQALDEDSYDEEDCSYLLRTIGEYLLTFGKDACFGQILAYFMTLVTGKFHTVVGLPPENRMM